MLKKIQENRNFTVHEERYIKIYTTERHGSNISLGIPFGYRDVIVKFNNGSQVVLKNYFHVIEEGDGQQIFDFLMWGRVLFSNAPYIEHNIEIHFHQSSKNKINMRKEFKIQVKLPCEKNQTPKE